MRERPEDDASPGDAPDGLVLTGHLTDPASARRYVAHQCRRAPAEVLKTTQLLVTELVNNAIDHGLPPMRVRVLAADGAVRGEVSDEGPGEPRLVHADPLALTGRGLALVDAYAADWGVERHAAGPGKTAWFTLPIA